jgi:hypothetical protein
MRVYLGLPALGWALVAWGAITGTFGVVIVYRLLISHRPEDEAFMGPAEIRTTLEHIRQVNRVAIGFGAASALALVLIGAAWALRLL